VTGSSTGWSRDHVLPHITERLSYAILRDLHVAAVFGIGEELAASWPYQASAPADTLVEQAFRQLGAQGASATATATRSEFAMMQQAARRGAEAISAILTFDEESDSDLHPIITACYGWLAALGSLPAAPSISAVPSPNNAAKVPYLAHVQTNLGA
jgi:hypothetical protein